MVEKLLLFQKMYDLTVWLYPLVNKLPKHHRFVLGNQIHATSLKLLTTAIQANKIAPGPNRKKLQESICVELDTLRILIRLTKDIKVVSVRQYIYASEKINEIGRIHQGWMKSR